MASRFSTSRSSAQGEIRTTTRRRTALPSMSVQQVRAYLIARDTLRRIGRFSGIAAERLSPNERPRTSSSGDRH